MTKSRSDIWRRDGNVDAGDPRRSEETGRDSPGRSSARPSGQESKDGGRLRPPFHVVERDAYDRLVWAFNALVAGLALLFLLPVMLVIAAAIKLDSPGPIIYRQLRVGIDRREGISSVENGRRTLDIGGRPFTIYKFRTMRVGAEAESGPVWSPSSDDRVTRVGRFLRKHRLDELPQLWNVVKGDMSIVGPRPERPSLVSDLREEIPEYPLRQKVLPGITGWAQVNQGSDQTIDDVRSKLRFDLEYLEERSILFDLWIMARTFPVMLEQDTDREGEMRGPEDQEDTRRTTRSVAT